MRQWPPGTSSGYQSGGVIYATTSPSSPLETLDECLFKFSSPNDQLLLLLLTSTLLLLLWELEDIDQVLWNFLQPLADPSYYETYVAYAESTNVLFVFNLVRVLKFSDSVLSQTISNASQSWKHLSSLLYASAHICLSFLNIVSK